MIGADPATDWEFIKDWWAIISAVALGIGWAVDRYLTLRKERTAKEETETTAHLDFEAHRDRLLIEAFERTDAIMAASQQQITQLIGDLREAQLKPAQMQVEHAEKIARKLALLREAMIHIRALLEADETGNREAAEHSAKLFLARVEIVIEAEGVAANAAQVASARKSPLIGRKGDE